MVVYELWDSRSNKLVATFSSESEALQVIAQAIVEQGEAVAEQLELLWDDQDKDQYGVIAVGQALIERAKSAA